MNRSTLPQIGSSILTSPAPPPAGIAAPVLAGSAALLPAQPTAGTRGSFGAELPEEQRNRLLRRVDWRYLLPDPSIGTVTCFAGGALAEGVRLVADRVADPNEAEASDLAVVRNPGMATLRAAWSALRPGGTLYCEFSAPRWGGAKRVRRQLEAAGFEPIACFWPWPRATSGRVKFWLPLDAPATLHHFWGQHVLVRFPILRHGGHLPAAHWARGIGAGLLPSTCFIAKKRGSTSVPTLPRAARGANGAEPSPLPARLTELLEEGWERWGFGPRPKRWSWMMLTLGPRSISKVVGVVLADEDPTPRLVVKLARVPEATAGLRREARTLSALGERFSGGYSGVPRFLFMQDEQELSMLGEGALAGAPLWRRLHPANQRDLALRATDWLVDFALRSPTATEVHPAERIAGAAFELFCEQFGSVVESGLLHQTERLLAQLQELPVVCEQRDFSPWNVLLGENGQLQVLDWESAEIDGLPLLDLVYYLGYLGFFASGAIRSRRMREHYRSSLDPSTPFGRIRAECLARYCTALGLDSELVRPLSLLTWLIHTRSEFGHFSSDAAGAPTPAALRESLFLGLWQEELRWAARRRESR